MIGEAFITNELFHEFGDINDRKELVMKYMDIYTDYVYESKALYGTENHKGIKRLRKAFGRNCEEICKRGKCTIVV